jgi:hypothetical protein
MKKLLIILTTILAASSLFSACKINSGGNPPAKADTEKKDTKKVETAESNPKSKALGDSEEQEDEWHLEILRSYRSSEKPEGPSRHGDYSYFKELENGGTVGSLHLFKPREAIFILWDGEVIAGPLTTVEEVEEAYEMLSRQSAAEHETRMNIINNFPTGRKKVYRVYDSKGNLIREDEEP